jgi:hypothetical protein
MKLLGDALFYKDQEGRLKSGSGTIFVSSEYPGLVTLPGTHAMQRQAWVNEVNRVRTDEGKPALTSVEIGKLLESSVDLIVFDKVVLIRPDPNRMDLAFQADEELQKVVSKRQIRFLNTHAKRVRDALRVRGENWRMARDAKTREEVDLQILRGRCAIDNEAIYYYNGHTGTRYLTVGTYELITSLSDMAFRAQIEEIVNGLNSRNRLGMPVVDIFPPAINPEIRKMLCELNVKSYTDVQLREAIAKIEQMWRMEMPAELRNENPQSNLVWKAEMGEVLSKKAFVTDVGDRDLIHGISPEFYHHIQWLPGCRVENGKLIFDSIYDEYNRTQDPELAELCDLRVRSIIFNLLRLFGSVEYVNVGRIPRSLVRTPIAEERRSGVYIVQYKEQGEPISRVFILRFQKWGIAEHLDEGKDMLSAIIEADTYSDYIMDRRLACRQLGMSLPKHVGFGQFTEKYMGNNQYHGTTIRAYYYVRQYVHGVASDKILPERFHNPAFAHKFAELMGAAAALDLVVGRRTTETNEPIFDKNYEVLQLDPKGIPVRLIVTDHAGSFVDYVTPLEQAVPSYANVVLRREKFVPDFADFAKTYVAAFERRLSEVQSAYRERRSAFDDLFMGRPYDRAGSGAYRWACVLKRLDSCSPQAVAEALKKAIQA